MSEIMVDIVCLTYNHEKYIAKTLEGFLSQKTNFKYRIIVHDDASTDNTASVIKEYAEKYPEMIFPIYQTVNQYSQRISISQRFIAPIINSKYVAICEGDDYWVDENKLQMQVDALENHPNCYMCTHKVQAVYEDETPFDKTYPSTPYAEGEVSSEEVIGGGFIFHTSSYFFRAKEFLEYYLNKPEFSNIALVGDLSYLLYFANKGNVYYIDKTMSHYRYGVPSSFSAKQAKNVFSKGFSEHQRRNFEMLLAFNEYSNGKFWNVLLRRMSRFKFKALIYDRKAIEFFKVKENKVYFDDLSLALKLYVCVGVVCPALTDYILRKFVSLKFEKRGY